MPIYDELWAREDKLGTPGGSALNSARAQRHANSAGSVAYFGCIADDAFGNALNDSVNAAGIDGKFDKSTTNATGTCAAVVVGKERTLCANIAAAKDFKMEYLQANMVSQSPAQTISNCDHCLGLHPKSQVPVHDWFLR